MASEALSTLCLESRMANQGEAHFPKNLQHRRSPSFVPTPPGAQACPLGSVLPQASASPQAIIRDYYLGTKLFSSALFANPRKGGAACHEEGRGALKPVMSLCIWEHCRLKGPRGQQVHEVGVQGVRVCGPGCSWTQCGAAGHDQKPGFCQSRTETAQGCTKN